MAEPTASLTFLELYTELGRYLWDKEVADLSALQVTKVKKCANDGYRRFWTGAYWHTTWSRRKEIRVHQWSFLKPAATRTFWTTVTGTATGSYPASVGTITATAAAFYPSMVGRTISFDVSGSEFTIIGYTSTTVVTVSTDPSAETAKAFTITANGLYRLPDDYGSLVDPFAFSTSHAYPALVETSVAQIRRWQAGEGSNTSKPRYYAPVPATWVTATGLRWDVLIWPTPDATYADMTYRYRRVYAEMTAVTDYPIGAALHSECIQEFALAAAEQRYGDKTGVHKRQAEALMEASVRLDLQGITHEGSADPNGRRMTADRADLEVTYTLGHN